MDEIYARVDDDLDTYEKVPSKDESQIWKFYAGKTIFLTGCTGYVGKCLVEKLLRTCTNIKTIYALVRPMKGQSVEQRIQTYFEDCIFERLRKENLGAMKKIVPIAGDLLVPDLGISPEDRRNILESTDIIIHNGATVLFHQKPRVSLQINVLSTKKLLELANECSHLEAFVYVSTAYSHPYLKDVFEKFYPPPGNMQMVHDIIRADTETESGLSEAALTDLLGNWSNIYTFSKAFAERLIQEHSTTAPYCCVVFRPGIVCSTYKEPIRSWVGNVHGPVLVFLGICMGVIHTCYMKGDPCMDYVPVDMTCNALIAITWDAVTQKKSNGRVYNYGVSVVHPVTLKTCQKYIGPYLEKIPSMKSVWKYFMILTEKYYAFVIMHYLLHFLPSLLFDLFNVLRFKKPVAVPVFLKLNKYFPKIMEYMHGNWRIHVTEMENLWSRMNAADHEHFNSDLRKIDWKEYISFYWVGLRKYLLKDPMETLPAARRRYKVILTAHYSILTCLILFLAYFVYSIVYYVFNLL